MCFVCGSIICSDVSFSCMFTIIVWESSFLKFWGRDWFWWVKHHFLCLMCNSLFYAFHFLGCGVYLLAWYYLICTLVVSVWALWCLKVVFLVKVVNFEKFSELSEHLVLQVVSLCWRYICQVMMLVCSIILSIP